MSTFPVLYKRDSKGNVRVWRMEVEGATYRTVAGIMDGQLVTSEWTIAEPKNIGKKNATTAEQQAQLEVESHYTKKLDIDYHLNVDEIDTPKIFKPMLAAKWKDRKVKLNFNDTLFVQPKLDGIRCIINCKGAFSRTGEPIVAIPHILDALSIIFDENPDAIFDGELYNHDFKHDFNKIVSMVRKTKPTPEDILLSEQKVQYHVYDYPGSMHESFNERYTALRRLVDNLKHMIQVVHTIPVSSIQEIDLAYGSFLQEGYEGGIIRLNGAYEQKRSNQLIKRKDFDDDEFEIVSVHEGKGNWSGCAKMITVKLPNGGVCEATIQGSMDYCQHVLRNAGEYIGKQATVRYFGYTPDGALRFPIAKTLHKDKRW